MRNSSTFLIRLHSTSLSTSVKYYFLSTKHSNYTFATLIIYGDMGIRHLEKFMKENVVDGFEEVSIVEECRNYQRNNNGEKPTLVLDLMSLYSLLNRDEVEMLYGGRSGKYWKMIDNLFKKLSNVAKLVFFSDGPVVPTKYDTWIKRQEDKYPKYLQVIDLIYERVPIAEIVNTYGVPSLSAQSKVIKCLAKTYGTLTKAITRECDAEIAKYASENRSVLAVMSDDSDFLVFPGRWRYFSVRELNMENLTTREFSRTALRKYLKLNDFQMKLLATIAGNDVIKYDEVRWVHGRNFDHRASIKFPAIAEMIRNKVSRDSYPTRMHNLASFLLGNDSYSSVERIRQSINQYNTSFTPNEDIDDSENSNLLKFCRYNDYTLVYVLLQGLPKNLTLGYYDLRRDDWPNFGEIRIEIFSRQAGIILKHHQLNQQETFCKIYTKLSHDERHQQISVKPSYPEFEFPQLLQLLDRSEYPEMDDVRFKLLKWSISETLQDVDLSNVTCRYLTNILSLYLMVQKNFISIKEADLILLSIKNLELDIIPDDLVFPPVVDERAFRIVFLFFKFFSTVGAGIKYSGLKHLLYPINLDGVNFHKMYLDFMDSGRDPAPLLRDIDHYRIYKNL